MPLECPQEVLELQQRCISPEPSERPSAAEIVEIILGMPKTSSGEIRRTVSPGGVPAVQGPA